MIGKEWLLITAEKDGKANTMTASWGGVGVLWGKNVATLYIRPQRYTKEFVDASDTLSLSVLDESFRKTLNYLGTVSGRDENKIEKSRAYCCTRRRHPILCRGKHRSYLQKTVRPGFKARMLLRCRFG